MFKLIVIACAVCLLAGCGGGAGYSAQDKQIRSRDAKVILADFKFVVGAAEKQRSKPIESVDAAGEVMKRADEARAKYRGTPIEPEATQLCLALATYYEMAQKNAGDREAAAVNVTKAKEALEAVADGK